VQVPRSLLRDDRCSIYQRHGGVRYATRAQSAMEERLVAQAMADTAPRLTRVSARRRPGTASGHAGRARKKGTGFKPKRSSASTGNP
jgi:hypothetical protein